MPATIDPSALPFGPASVTIGLLERNRTVLLRAARVLRAAANLDWVAADADPALLRPQLAPATRLLACEAADAELLLGWIGESFPHARMATWSHEPTRWISLAERDDRLVSLIGWPSFQSMPRSWELALATRMILSVGAEPTTANDIVMGNPVMAEFHPRTPEDRDHVVATIGNLVERAGAPDRMSARIGEVAHELVMNATYDAPVSPDGEPRYAHDRRAPVTLASNEVPHVQFATDGILVAIQVTDHFGRLTRDHVLASVQRGASATQSVASEVVDRSYGGAGLGLWRVYASSAVTIVDILPGHTTTVTAVFDLDLGHREARSLPPSLHLFDRGRMG